MISILAVSGSDGRTAASKPTMFLNTIFLILLFQLIQLAMWVQLFIFYFPTIIRPSSFNQQPPPTVHPRPKPPKIHPSPGFPSWNPPIRKIESSLLWMFLNIFPRFRSAQERPFIKSTFMSGSIRVRMSRFGPKRIVFLRFIGKIIEIVAVHLRTYLFEVFFFPSVVFFGPSYDAN